jgi:hypothetical protein
MPHPSTRQLSVFAAIAGVIAAIWLAPALVGPTLAGHRKAVELPGFDELRHGDLIFRSGVSPDSALVRFVDPASAYSHVGLIDIADGQPYIVHIETGTASGASDVRREPLAMFLAADRADGFAVFHLAETDRRRGPAAIAEALRYRDDGVVFDQRADLATEHEQYCTEMVWRVSWTATSVRRRRSSAAPRSA